MKIFYKKDFQRVLEEKEQLVKRIAEERKISEFKIKNLKEELYTKAIELNNKIEEYKSKLAQLELDLMIQKDNNNKLIKEKEELEEKLKESMTGKYVLKKISAGRTPNLQKTKVSRPMSNNVRNYMKEKHDY